MIKYILIFCLLLQSSAYSFSGEDITNMYASYVEEWKSKCKVAFDNAELKVFKVAPKPDIIGPNEDPKKCICKGTGIIVQGDNHKTICPFHGKTTSK